MALEVELEVLKTVVTKLDSSLEKISEVSNSIGRLLAVHDERLNSLEKTSDRRNDEIKDLHSRITTQQREIMDKLEDMEKRLEERMTAQGKASKAQHDEIKEEIQEDVKRLDDRIGTLEKWKWYIIGAGAAVGYLVSNVLPLISK